MIYQAEIAVREHQLRRANDLYSVIVGRPGVPDVAKERLTAVRRNLFDELVASAATAGPESTRLLREALKIDPNARNARMLLVQRLIAEKNWNEAQRELAPLTQWTPTPATFSRPWRKSRSATASTSRPSSVTSGSPVATTTRSSQRGSRKSRKSGTPRTCRLNTSGPWRAKPSRAPISRCSSTGKSFPSGSPRTSARHPLPSTSAKCRDGTSSSGPWLSAFSTSTRSRAAWAEHGPHRRNLYATGRAGPAASGSGVRAQRAALLEPQRAPAILASCGISDPSLTLPPDSPISGHIASAAIDQIESVLSR